MFHAFDKRRILSSGMASVFSFVVLVILHVMIIALLVLRQGHAQLGDRSNFVTILTEAILLKDDDIIITSVAGGRKMLMDQFSSKVMKEKHMSDRRASNVAGDATSESKKAHMTAQVDGSKEFRDAENEVAKLMSKDYSGRSGPRRKPPINNHKPTD
ncbi:PREDICTED: uncharacterized protein LOC109242320 isoform X2 [Nicotiana attenuata]|uniref:uncharacterized protein LOC109242320 isoform X2 n=1 Tax=Nicotiana attenuata TaxID=49451 RepID=UPI000905891F|nr:PREDICTED: uncharacterized protein LOC109242320 isoform X2 [Nicotiana attenuata]